MKLSGGSIQFGQAGLTLRPSTWVLIRDPNMPRYCEIPVSGPFLFTAAPGAYFSMSAGSRGT